MCVYIVIHSHTPSSPSPSPCHDDGDVEDFDVAMMNDGSTPPGDEMVPCHDRHYGFLLRWRRRGFLGRNMIGIYMCM